MGIPQVGIAFFDSGIGGLTVLAECEKRLPNEKFYYYGDNRHAPYGNLSKEQMRPYVLRAFDTFARLRVKAAVIACNTVTALFAEELRARYDFPIVGTEPAIRVGAKVGGDIFVLTTRATYESARFRKLCATVAPNYPKSTIKAFACDGLAGAIENHINEEAYDYAPLLPKGSPSAVILGCTHYTYIKEYIRAYYGCPVFDGNEGIATRLSAILAQTTEEKLGYTTTNEPRSVKNRDGKPPPPDFAINFTLKTQKREGKGLRGYKTNKCSLLKFRNVRKYKGKTQIRSVRFLGESGQKNLKLYERMFVSN